MRSDETVTKNYMLSWRDMKGKGVDILIDGYQASPLQIVTAYMAKEEGTYCGII